MGEQALFGERVGDAGVGEHEGIEHLESAVEESAEDDGEGERWSDRWCGRRLIQQLR